jgi:putative thioredoxin
MLELGGQPEAGADVIKDGTDATFMEDVVDASKEAAVIVDFWAPWCGPCKQLGPALEAAVKAKKGAVRLVKIDVDKNQMVAGQLRVQSIPAVFAFVDGQPVDGFMGALPPSEIQAFVDRVAAQGPGGDPIAAALDQAEAMLEEGAASDAMQVFAAVLQEKPEEARAIGGLARAYLAIGDVARAKATLDAAPPLKQHEGPIQAARSAIELTEATADVGETAELRARLDANPDDHQARLDLALALIAARDHEAAIEELLEIVRRDRDWNEGAARAQLFKLFDTLGPKDPRAAKGRRRLSSILFA